MHQSFVTTAPTSPLDRAGYSRANVSYFYFCIGPKCRANVFRLLGNTSMVLPAGCPCSVGFIAGMSKYVLFCVGGNKCISGTDTSKVHRKWLVKEL